VSTDECPASSIAVQVQNTDFVATHAVYGSTAGRPSASRQPPTATRCSSCLCILQRAPLRAFIFSIAYVKNVRDGQLQLVQVAFFGVCFIPFSIYPLDLLQPRLPHDRLTDRQTDRQTDIVVAEPQAEHDVPSSCS
jgi:hypothetical protein